MLKKLSIVFKMRKLTCMMRMIVFSAFLWLTVILYSVMIRNSGSSIVDDEDLSEYYRFKSQIERTRPPQDTITCSRLFEDNQEEQARAVDILQSINTSALMLPDSNYIFDRSKCDWFKEIRGYNRVNPKQSEIEFPLAYLILLHDQVEQFERQLRLIYQPQNVYCIHVDMKSSLTVLKAIQSIAACFDNVFLTTKRESVIWSGMTLLQADLNCMSDLLNLNKLVNIQKHPSFRTKRVVSWKYVINLASTMMPLKTNYELTRILRMYNGSNEVEIFSDDRNSDRYTYRWILDDQSPFPRPLSERYDPPPHDLKIIKGSNYVALSRSFTNFIINSHFSKDLIKWANFTSTPDEMLWGTLLYNSPRIFPRAGFRPYTESYFMPTLSIYIVWPYLELKGNCYSSWRSDICMLSIYNLPLLGQVPHFFANKFLLDYDPIGFRCMEEWYANRTRMSAESLLIVDMEYYCNFIRKRSTLEHNECSLKQPITYVRY